MSEKINAGEPEVQLSDEKLRNILNELVAKNGLKETKDFISTRVEKSCYGNVAKQTITGVFDG